MRIGWDIDGCGHIFANGVMDYMDTIDHPYDLSYRGEVQSWNFHDRWGCDREAFKKICDDGVDAGYVFRGHVHEGYFEAMRVAKELGHQNIVITDRFFGTPDHNGNSPSHSATFDWFAENGAMSLVDEFHFSPNKLIVPTDMFIEDKLENYDALVAGGVNAFLINRPWNQVPGGDARNRIDSMWEYGKAIKRISEQGFADLTFA